MRRGAMVVLLSSLTIFLVLFAAGSFAAEEEGAMGSMTAEEGAMGSMAAEEEGATGSMAAEEESVIGSPVFTVGRLVIAGSVENSEPVGAVNAFPSSTEKVYCFLEARDISEDTHVVFAWYHEDTKKADVELPLRKGPRWRTYSSKKLGGLTGSWRVDLNDAEGNVLQTATFTVE